MTSSSERDAWRFDQVTKSEFFHQKLHEWQLLKVASQIERVKGEALPWEWARLGISPEAWDKIIHRGIKPVVIFASARIDEYRARSQLLPNAGHGVPQVHESRGFDH